MNDNNNSNKRRRSTPALSGYSADVGAGSSADVEAVSSADDGWNGQLGYVWIFRCCRTKDGQQLSYYILFMFLRNSNSQTRWLFSCSASKILPQTRWLFSCSASTILRQQVETYLSIQDKIICASKILIIHIRSWSALCINDIASASWDISIYPRQDYLCFEDIDYSY